MSWTTSCSPDISWLLICWALCCISGIIQMFDAVSWWRRLEKEVILHLLTHNIFVALNISLCKTASILNCWPWINGSVSPWILHSLIFLVVQFLLVCICPTILISKHFWKSTLALSFISCWIVGPRNHHSTLLILLLLALLVLFHAHGYILNMGSSLNVLTIRTDNHLFMVRRTWLMLHHSPHWTHTSHWDCALSARSLMVKFLIGSQLLCFWRLLHWLTIAKGNVNSIHNLLLLSFAFWWLTMHHSGPFVLQSVVIAFGVSLLHFLDILILVCWIHSSTMWSRCLSWSHALAWHCHILLLVGKLRSTIRTLRIKGNSVSIDHVWIAFRCLTCGISVKVSSGRLSSNDSTHNCAFVHGILIDGSATSCDLSGLIINLLRSNWHAGHSLAISTAGVHSILTLIVLLLKDFGCHYTLAMTCGCCSSCS